MNNNSVKFGKYAQILGSIGGGLVISLPLGLPGISGTASAQQTTSVLNPCPRIYYEEPYNNRLTSPQNCPPNAFTLRQSNQGFTSFPPTATTPLPEESRLGVGGEYPPVEPDNLSQRTPIPPDSALPQPSTPQTGGQTTIPTPPGTRTQTPQQRPLPTTPTPGTGRPTITPTTPPPGTGRPTITPTTPTPGTGRPTTIPPRQTQPTSPSSGIETPTQRQTLVPTTTIALRDGRVNLRLVNDSGARVTYQVIDDTEPRSLEDRNEARLEGLNAPLTLTFQREGGGLLRVTARPSRERGTLEVTLQETQDVNQDTRALRIQDNGGVFLN